MHSDIKLYRAADNAVDGFFTWMQNFEPPPKRPLEFTCMFDYIEDWLNGPAADDCYHDHHIFLTAVTLIVASWSEGMDADNWPYMSRIKQVLDPEHRSYDILDPQVFMMRSENLREQQAQLRGCRLPNQG